MATNIVTGHTFSSGELVTAAKLNTAVNSAVLTDADITATGSTAARSLSDRAADVVNVLDYGVKNDGTQPSGDTNTTRIQNAVSAGDVVYFPYGTYNLGVIDDANVNGLLFADKDNLTIHASGATLKVTTSSPTGAILHSVLRFKDCNNISIFGSLSIEGGVAEDTNGPSGIVIECDAKNINNFYIENVTHQYGRAAVEITNGVGNDHGNTYRCKHIVINSLEARESKYGYLGAQNGDHCVIDSLSTNDVVRSFYVYGVDNVVANVESYAHPTSSADCLINTYYRDTRNIKVRYIPHTNASAEYLVRVVHMATTGSNAVTGPASGKVIENIDIYYDDENVVPGTGSNNWGITLREEDTTTAARASSPHVMRNVKIGGKFTRPYGLDTMINTPTAFANAGRLYVDEAFFDAADGTYTFKKWLADNPLANWHVHMGGNRWARNLIGDLEVTDGIRWSVSEGSGMFNNFKIMLSIIQDFTKTVGGGGAASWYGEYIVTGSVRGPGSGTVNDFSYGSTTALTTQSTYGGVTYPTVTFSAATDDGGTDFDEDQCLKCVLASANGATPANGRAIGIIEFF